MEGSKLKHMRNHVIIAAVVCLIVIGGLAAVARADTQAPLTKAEEQESIAQAQANLDYFQMAAAAYHRGADGLRAPFRYHR